LFNLLTPILCPPFDIFTVTGAKVVVNGVATIATAEVSIFIPVVDTPTEVLTATGREVVPGGGGVEKALV
jgi:hypothetical protein